MIIVEGPDGAGKTSLAEKIAEALGVGISPKLYAGDMTNMGEPHEYVDKHLGLGFGRRVYDRFMLYSSPIYSAMTRRITPQPGMENFEWVSNAYAQMRDVAPLVIICLPSWPTVLANIERDEDNRKIFGQNKNKLATVYWLYFNLAARNPAMLRYNYEKDDTEDFVARVVSLVEHRM